MKKKAKRAWTASVAALLFASVLGSAALLTLSSPRAEYLPAASLWENTLLPRFADEPLTAASRHGDEDFRDMDLVNYRSAFTTQTQGGENAVAALNPTSDSQSVRATEASDTTGVDSSGTHPTFHSIPSAWDAVHSELERSLEPPSGLSGRSSGGRGSAGNLASYGEDDGEDVNNEVDLPDLDSDSALNPGSPDSLLPGNGPSLPEHAVPEPHSLTLLLMGLLGLGVLRHSRTT